MILGIVPGYNPVTGAGKNFLNFFLHSINSQGQRNYIFAKALTNERRKFINKYMYIISYAFSMLVWIRQNGFTDFLQPDALLFNFPLSQQDISTCSSNMNSSWSQKQGLNFKENCKQMMLFLSVNGSFAYRQNVKTVTQTHEHVHTHSHTIII